MKLHITWRNFVIAGALAVIIVFGITHVLLPDSDSGGPSWGYVPLVTPTPIPRNVLAVDMPQPGGASASSVLVMIQGLVDRRLVIWPLADNKPPQEVDHHVNPGLLLPSPGKTHVLYSTDHTLMALDVAERRANIVADLPARGARVRLAQWSPDGSAIAFVAETDEHKIAYYTRADGSTHAVPMLHTPAGLPLDVAWLADGRPVSIFMGVGPVGGLEARYQLYDPATGDALMLPPDTPLIQPFAPWRAPDGAQQVYTMASRTKSAYAPCREGAIGLAGPEWLYLTSVGGRGKPRDVAFALEDVYLYWPTWVADGHVLFWGIADEACDPAQSGLYVARLDEAPRQIVQTQPIYDTDDTGDTLWSASYTLSPDLRLVAWIENDVQAETSAVYLTPLVGGAPDQLYETPPIPANGPPFAFRDSQMILELTWLP